MIFATETFGLPSKEVYFEDKGKTVSYPGTMHEDDIKLHADINEYGKTPHQSFIESMSDLKFWDSAKEESLATIKAFGQMIEAATEVPGLDSKLTERQKLDQFSKNTEQIASAFFDATIYRVYNPVRKFVADVVSGKTDELGADVVKAAILPSSVENQISKAYIESDLGTNALIPAAILSAVEEVIPFLGSPTKSISKMLDEYEVNAVKKSIWNNSIKIQEKIAEKMNLTLDEAAEYMSRPAIQSQIYYAQKAALNRPTLFSGLPMPSGESAKAIGKNAGESVSNIAKKPEAVAGALSSAINPPYKERSFVTSIQDEMPQLKVAGQYIPRSTDELAKMARTQIADDIAVAEKMAMSGTDDASIATGAELLKHYCQQAEKSTDPAIADMLYEKAATLGNDMAERLTELGRSVQAASILSRMTPEGQVKFAAKTIQKYNEAVDKETGLFSLKKKIPDLGPEQAKSIATKVREIQSLPDGEDKALRWKALQDTIAELVPTPMMKRIVTVWKAGLLTGLKTSGLNIASNFSHGILETIKDVPAMAVDSVASLFTKHRTTTFNVAGIGKGAKEGFEKGWKFLRTGYDERDVLSKLDYSKVSFGKSKVGRALQAYEETVFKVLGAEDQIFYYGAKARSIVEQAKVAGINSGLKGTKRKEFVDNLIKNPTDDILTLAVSDAEMAVFQNKTALSEAAAGMKKAVPVSEFILPFSKTPSSVAMQIINYSPVGGTYKTLLEAKKVLIDKKPFDQRGFSKSLGRSFTGVGILAFGGYLYQQGVVALDKPKTESEQKQWELEGKKPNSVFIDGKWRSVQVLGPAGNLLLIGGQFRKALDDEGSPTKAWSVALASSGKSFTQQTFLTGVNQFTEALNDPLKKAEGFTGGIVSSVVPTIIGNVARATDDTERRVEGISDRLVAKLPFFRTFLEPQVDVLGRNRMKKENFLETMLDPTSPSAASNDPVVSELHRIISDGNTIALTQLGDKEGYSILTPAQNTELWQQSGSIAFEKIYQYMNMNDYENIPDDVKAKDISKIFSESKNVARASIVLDVTQGLEGDQLIQKLKELKESKLLTREVYKRYEQMR